MYIKKKITYTLCSKNKPAIKSSTLNFVLIYIQKNSIETFAILKIAAFCNNCLSKTLKFLSGIDNSKTVEKMWMMINNVLWLICNNYY